MAWFESAADLPAPRDDEPAHLRQDIQDELADHLQSALERELRQHTDEATARERVLEQFGDPRRVARKLWMDAMKEKLMSQRVQMVASVLMLVTCAGMFWMTATIAGQGRAVDQAILARLDTLATESAARFDLEWNPTSVQLVTASGRPLPEGFRVQLKTNSFHLEQRPDAQGVAQFGRQHPGSCWLRVTAPWGESTDDGNLAILAGEPFSLTIVCPDGQDRIEAPLRIEWPKHADSDVLLACWIQLENRVFDGRTWGSPDTFRVLIDRAGHTMLLSEQEVNESQIDGLLNGYPESQSKLAAPLKTSPALALPSFAAARVRVIPVHVEGGDTAHPTLTKLGPSALLPFTLVRDTTAHWELTVPEDWPASEHSTFVPAVRSREVELSQSH